MSQRRRLRRLPALLEELAFEHEPLLERQGRGRFHCADDALRRHLAARLPGDACAGTVDRGARGIGLGYREVAYAAQPRGLCQQPFRVRDRAAFELAVDQFVNEPPVTSVGGIDGVAAQDQLQGAPDARESRSALCAPRSGQYPELDLGETDARVRERAAIVTTECDFEATSQRVPVNGRDQQFRALLESRHDVRQVGQLRGFAELADVRTRNEGASPAEDHACLESRLRVEEVHRRDQARADRLR